MKEILAVLPESEFFAVVDFLGERDREHFEGRNIKTSFIQRLPLAKARYRSYLPIMPLAIEQLDFRGFDLLVSSHHAVAKGIIVGPDQLHISYVHSPMRYGWDLQHQYLEEANLNRGINGWVAKWILHRLRIWDARAANGVDVFVANSNYIARRIRKTYRREAAVIYPPVDVEHIVAREHKEDFFLAVSRMVPYKRMALIAEAFQGLPGRRLVIIGDGPQMGSVKKMAGRNVTVLGYQPTEVVRNYMSRARALVFAAEEDFGITPVEAQAAGTPVIAFGRGGCRETVRPLEQTSPTGVFFEEQSVNAIREAVKVFEEAEGHISAKDCVENANRFSAGRFRREFAELVQKEWTAFREERGW